MRKCKTGLIIFVSSIRAFESHFYRGLYAATKSALESIAFDWAVSLMPWGVRVCVIEPGPLSTNPTVIRGSQFNRSTNPYPEIDDFHLCWQSPNEICSLIQEIIDTPCLAFRYQTNANTQATAKEHLKDPSGKKWLKKQKKWFQKATNG